MPRCLLLQPARGVSERLDQRNAGSYRCLRQLGGGVGNIAAALGELLRRLTGFLGNRFSALPGAPDQARLALGVLSREEHSAKQAHVLQKVAAVLSSRF